MTFTFHDQKFIPEDSHSRQLDRMVAMDEYPYGYDGGEPPEGHHNTAMTHKYKNPREKRERAI